MISKTYSRILRPKILKIQSKTPLSEPIQTVTNSNSDDSDASDSDKCSDSSVVTLYSVVKPSDLYSVVVRLYSAYSDYNSNNHTNSLYSVVVKSLFKLCVEFAYSVVVRGAGGTVLCYNITGSNHHLRVVLWSLKHR